MKSLAIGAILFQLAIAIAAVGGYVTNIVKLVHHVGPFAAMEVVRAIGIVVPPMGAIMGYVG